MEFEFIVDDKLVTVYVLIEDLVEDSEDDGVEYDEDGVAWWYDEEGDVYYYFDGEDWVEYSEE